MGKAVATGLKFVFLGACLIFIFWGLETFMKSESIYSLTGWCYTMLGTVAPSVVLLGHSERRARGRYLSERTCLWLEMAVLIGAVLFGTGMFSRVGFLGQLILSLAGFFMAVPASFVFMYLSPPKSVKKPKAE